LVLSFLYVYVSRNKKNEEIQNGSANKLSKERKKMNKVEMHSVFTTLQKDGVDGIIGVTSLWQEK